jgi:hypothetical protein
MGELNRSLLPGWTTVNKIRVRCVASHIEDEQIETEVDGNVVSKTVRFTHIYNLVSMTPLGISFAEACAGKSQPETFSC